MAGGLVVPDRPGFPASFFDGPFHSFSSKRMACRRELLARTQSPRPAGLASPIKVPTAPSEPKLPHRTNPTAILQVGSSAPIPDVVPIEDWRASHNLPIPSRRTNPTAFWQSGFWHPKPKEASRKPFQVAPGRIESLIAGSTPVFVLSRSLAERPIALPSAHRFLH